MFIGKIVKSYSHINYVCQIYGSCDVEIPPNPTDYAFGRFVWVAVNSRIMDESAIEGGSTVDKQDKCLSYVVGLIYDTTLLNPAFGLLGPRLSNETQVEIFSPDYISEIAILSHVFMLGIIERHVLPEDISRIRVIHGIPSLSPALGSRIETMGDEDVRLFHYFSDHEATDAQKEYLHMGYLPHMINQQNSLLTMAVLRIIDQLEYLFPQNLTLLSIVKRNFAWRLKVETTG